MEFDLDFEDGFDWGFMAVGADEVDQGKKQTEAISQVVQDSGDLKQHLTGLDGKLEQILAVTQQTWEDRLTQKESDLEFANKDKFVKLEKMIIPLLQNLAKSSEEPYIYWPKRKEIIEGQIKRILEITRG